MKITNPTIKKLNRLYKEISLLGKIKSVLDWDLNVNLPPKASSGRAEQSAYLTEKMTKLWLATEFRTTLEKAQNEKDLSLEEKAIVRNLTNASKFYYRVPEEIIIEKEKVTSEAFMIWREAREKNDFASFLPSLKEIIRLNQIVAQHVGYKKNPYDALLDQFEPELTADFTEKVFNQIKPELVTLSKQIQKAKKYTSSHDAIDGSKTYPIVEQQKIGQFLMKRMQYDLLAGRIDVSPHPFTTSLDRYDVRVTTAYKEHDFRDSFTSTMHEVGHALYEQGINPEYAETPLEGGVSYGIHEAMSRFWENMVGKNPQFLRFVTPLLQGTYPKELGNYDEEDVIQMFTIVKPSNIRIEADEVTYSLHIILRFEMENALMNGKIKPEDAAEAWRAKAISLFGVTPETDSQGVLQDVHWTYGAFGYFPAYALGNLYGAQFLDTMKKTVKFEEDVSRGELRNILGWLNENIHTHGSLYYPKELTKKVTGKDLDPKYFIEYLKEKYTKLYSL